MEYAWTHNILDIFKDMEASFWPDEDWESLSLNESWRVRVASAQVFTIVRNRHISQYKRVLAFLERTHTLLPTLVPAIKHMKITFGLKTMVIMWMLREGAGPVKVVQKINKYFPRNLPQYQVHCRKHERFLMRQNQLDFRTFAQSLIMDKQKLEDYIQNRVEEQYGDHYAQKTEERLLDYLQDVDKALPKETYIDQIMKKRSFAKEEEKELLDLITDDSKAIATKLKTLLHCDPAFCRKSVLRQRTSNCTSPESRVRVAVSTADLSAAEKYAEAVGHVQSPVSDTITNDVKEDEEAAHTDISKTASAEKAIAMAIEESCPGRSAHVVQVPPHFCSKHQRWVRNILCECPGESSEEQPPQDSEISPQLFSSTSSSSDLTPSNLTIPPDHHQSPSASAQLQEAKEGVDKPMLEPVNSGPSLHPAPAAVQTFIPVHVVKVVIVPCKAPTAVTVCPLKNTSDDLSNGSNQDSTSSTLSITAKGHQTATSPSPFISKLSWRFRLGQNYSQSQKTYRKEDGSKNVEYSSQTGFTIAHAANLSVNATSGMNIASNALPQYTHLQAQSSPADHMPGSPDSSTFSSSRMQPCVVLKRLSTEECLKATKGRLHPRQCEDLDSHSDQAVSPFDVNSLCSSSSSSLSSSDEEDSDTEYIPDRKTLRRWFLGY